MLALYVFIKLLTETSIVLINFPKTTLLYSQSIYAAPRITPKLAITATKKLSLKAAIKIKNSPIKPLVPGKPRAAKVNNINKTEYFGMIVTIPPYELISLECIRSYTTPTQRNNAADTKP